MLLLKRVLKLSQNIDAKGEKEPESPKNHRKLSGD